MRIAFALATGLALTLPQVAFAATPTPTPSPSPTPSATDAALLEKIQAALAQPTPAAAASASVPRSSGGLTLSNAFNPAMSINGLFLGTYASNENSPGYQFVGPEVDNPTPKSLAIQEIEMQFLSNVDPYFQANLVLSSPFGQGIGLEEGWVMPFWQPAGFSFRFGQIKNPFGRESFVHTHALPFVDKSLVGQAVFGDDGLDEPSVEATWLAPAPWYSLVYLTAMKGDNTILYHSPRNQDLAGFAAWKNLFDLSEDSTLEAQVSGTMGTDSAGGLSQTGGADLIYKWKPARHATTRSAVVAVEAIFANKNLHLPAGITGATAQSIGGAYGYAQWQLARRWFVAGRYDYLATGYSFNTTFASTSSQITRRESAILVYVPTEFSAIRAQLSDTQVPGTDTPLWTGYLQFNFTLGAHPAHSY